MKINGKIVPVLYEEGWAGHRFKIYVYFKEDNQWFNRKCQKVILSTYHDELTYDELLDKALELLTNQEELMDIAKRMVIKYYEDKNKGNIMNSKEKKIREIINKKDIAFEMEINR